MTIAHINMIFSTGNMEGVKRKLRQQAIAFSNHDIDLYVLNRDVEGFIDGIRFVKIPLGNTLHEIFVRAFKYYYICKYIDISRYKKIIIRYTFMDLSFIYFSSIFKGDIYTEHHTNEMQELKQKSIPIIFKYVQFLLEHVLVKLFSRRVEGIIGVSPSITTTAKNRFRSSNAHTFSNGISAQEYLPYASRSYKSLGESHNKCLEIIFSASSFQEWHGLERLLSGVASYGGTKKVRLHLVGKLSNKQLELVRASSQSDSVDIVTHGVMSWEKLQEISLKCHVAVDSLGLHKLGITTGSTLKSKEYAALGIPFLYATRDPDLVDVSKVLFEIPSDGSPVDISALIVWFNHIDLELAGETLKKHANDKLTWEVKLAKLKHWLFYGS